MDVLKESQGRVKSLAMVHEKLYQSSGFTSINFKDYVEKLVYDILYPMESILEPLKLN